MWQVTRFVRGQHDGQPLGTTCANDAFNAVERLLQNMLVEKEDRGQSLVLGRRRDVFLDGQMSQETVDIAFRQLPGMLVLVELDEAANPMHVRFFRASAVMADTQNSDEVVVEMGRGFSLEQPQRLRSLSSRQHGITRLIRTWPFPVLEPLGMQEARTSVVPANPLPNKPSYCSARRATPFEHVSCVWSVR